MGITSTDMDVVSFDIKKDFCDHYTLIDIIRFIIHTLNDTTGEHLVIKIITFLKLYQLYRSSISCLFEVLSIEI